MSYITPGIRTFLEDCYEFSGRQMTVTYRKGEFIQVSFIWPDGARVAADRAKQREAKKISKSLPRLENKAPV